VWQKLVGRSTLVSCDEGAIPRDRRLCIRRFLVVGHDKSDACCRPCAGLVDQFLLVTTAVSNNACREAGAESRAKQRRQSAGARRAHASLELERVIALNGVASKKGPHRLVRTHASVPHLVVARSAFEVLDRFVLSNSEKLTPPALRCELACLEVRTPAPYRKDAASNCGVSHGTCTTATARFREAWPRWTSRT